jgi:hypothetical protein
MNRIHKILAPVAGGLAFALPFVAISAAPAQKPPAYHLIKRVPLGGDGFWDYFAVEPGTGHVFIPHGKKVIIVDADGNKLAEVPGFNGAHAITFAPKLKLAFISDGDQATFLSTETNQIVRHVDLSKNGPDAILFDPATELVFAFGDAGATVLDAKTGENLATIPLGGKPEFAQTDGAGSIFVNIEDKNEIAHLDAKAMKVLERWPIAPCEDPSGLAIDVAHTRLFAGCRNNLTVAVRYTDGKVLGSAPICKGTDASTYDPRTGMAFASCHDGTITAVGEVAPGKFDAVQKIVTEPAARTMALDPANHNVYTVTAKMGPPPKPTAENPHPWPSIVPNTFVLLIYKK